METISRKIQGLTQRTLDSTVGGAKEAIIRGGAVLLLGSVILWISVFIYVAFYYSYMPSISHSRPVHLQFQPCEPQHGVCSFPSAHVQLTKRHQLLTFGQKYRVYLNLDMPESPRNKELGMFMVCLSMRDKDGTLMSHSCRSAMLHYRSELLLTMKTLLFSPFLIFGPNEEKQGVIVELFADYEEDAMKPATDAYIEIQSRSVQIYSASLHIHAHFTGLRHLMFHWPILSASIGISSNLFFLGVICALSYFHLTRSTEEEGNEEMTDFDLFQGDLDELYEDESKNEEEQRAKEKAKEIEEEETKSAAVSNDDVPVKGNDFEE
ncbi:seipin isoform X2 [Neocloeon triangulifer]|uniref:seipin isoform X2 n=1 Tax=Neocloeon triangulifer TaxID=2078957 RepID=UPI00286EC2B0|nr:seipin isoform X2 [Neocloeon triangulifer]